MIIQAPKTRTKHEHYASVIEYIYDKEDDDGSQTQVHQNETATKPKL